MTVAALSIALQLQRLQLQAAKFRFPPSAAVGRYDPAVGEAASTDDQMRQLSANSVRRLPASVLDDPRGPFRGHVIHIESRLWSWLYVGQLKCLLFYIKLLIKCNNFLQKWAMNLESIALSTPRELGLGTGRTKLFWLAQGLRMLSVSYVAWTLLRVVQSWSDAEKVMKEMGRYLGRDLSALTDGARMMAMALDLGDWLLLLAAAVCGWRSLGYLIKQLSFSHSMARLLAWAGLFGALSQFLSLLIRPMQSYLMTAHLAASEQVFKWAFYPQDILSTLLCGVILCFAYLITWVVDVAEENRGFI